MKLMIAEKKTVAEDVINSVGDLNSKQYYTDLILFDDYPSVVLNNIDQIHNKIKNS